MRNAIRIFRLFVLAAAAVSVLAGAAGVASATAQRGTANKAPRLNEPHETVVIASADAAPVRFRWTAVSMRGDAHMHDELRIFRGNQAYADSMIHDVEVPAGQGTAEVPASVLSEPGVYSWTVRQVGTKDKSRKAFSVFKVERG